MNTMKNSYLIAGAIVLVAIIAFVFASRKTDAPTEVSTKNQAVVGAMTDGNYSVNTDTSVLKWTGEFVTGLTKEEGTIKIKSGEVVVEGGLITSGSFEIDMETIADNENKEKLIQHLRSDDFFSVATYPTAKFEITSFAPVNEQTAVSGRYVVGGNLTVKGITKPISFLATISTTDTEINSSSSFAINRADWDVKYGSTSFFEGLGDKAIRDAVQIDLELSATRSE